VTHIARRSYATLRRSGHREADETRLANCEHRSALVGFDEAAAPPDLGGSFASDRISS
jgi:hypothetical protein